MGKVSSLRIVNSFKIKPRTGSGFEVKKGQRLRIIDIEGEQVADFMCFSLRDSQEYLSSGRSIDYNGKLFLSSEDVLYSNRSNPLLTIETDQVGRHVFLFAPCSQEMFRISYGISEPHPNCLANLTESFRQFGIKESQIQTPFNVFMNIEIFSDGKMEIHPPLSKAGDYIEFRAEMDLAVAVSACSALRCNNYSCGPIGIEIRDVRI
jgi:hypothetical protein